MIKTIVKIASQLFSIFAVNYIAWELIITSFLSLVGLFYESDIIFYAQVISLIILIITLFWIKYRTNEEIKDARSNIL